MYYYRASGSGNGSGGFRHSGSERSIRRIRTSEMLGAESEEEGEGKALVSKDGEDTGGKEKRKKKKGRGRGGMGDVKAVWQVLSKRMGEKGWQRLMGLAAIAVSEVAGMRGTSGQEAGEADWRQAQRHHDGITKKLAGHYTTCDCLFCGCKPQT